MTSQSWKETIAMYILPNISKKKKRQSDNEIWSVSRYNKRNVFLKKHA